MRFIALACATALTFTCGSSFIACGGTTDTPPDSGNGNDGSTVDVGTEQDDGGSMDDGAVLYPADHKPMPLVDYNGGRVIQNPKIVTVTFAGDDQTLVPRFQQFGDIITSTPWWTAVSSEYCQQPGNTPCIGPGTSGGHVVLQDPPAASYIDSSTGAPSTLQDFIKAEIAAGEAADGGVGDAGDGTMSAFPRPDSNTLYIIYFPAGTSITLDGDVSCSSWEAYHNTALVPDPTFGYISAPYAIVPRCSTKESSLTISASHEVIEAATDPDIGINQISYYMFSDPLWTTGGGEVGDLCVGHNTTESTFTVQRTWSNLSAKASNDPCVPIPTGEIYFNAAPVTEKVVLPMVGSTAVLEIDPYSTAPYPPWTVSAIDYAAFQQGTPSLSFAFDKTSVQNGDKVELTITCVAAMPNGTDDFSITSTDSMKNHHSWPVQAVTK